MKCYFTSVLRPSRIIRPLPLSGRAELHGELALLPSKVLANWILCFRRMQKLLKLYSFASGSGLRRVKGQQQDSVLRAEVEQQRYFESRQCSRCGFPNPFN